MTDPTEFNIDLILNQPLSHKQQVELFAFDDCKTYRLPERKLLIRNPNNGKSAVIMPEVLTALAQCTKFAPLDDHITNVTRAIPQLKEHPDQVRQVLGNMIRDGMMVSAQSLCDAFNSVRVEDDPIAGEPAVVAIITCDRPEAIERLLNSVAENGDPAGFARLYLIDDSRKKESIERNRALVEAFNADSSIDTVYFGRERQRELMGEMINSTPEHEESIRFLIDFERWKDEWTGGLARNYALLLSRGKRLVMLDDDVLFQGYEPQPRPKGINLRDEIREAEFFDQIGNWPGLKLRTELDPVKAHLYCLGLPLRQAMKRLDVSALIPEHLLGCTVAEIRRLKPGSPVLVTQCGSLGDPGIGSNTWIIELTGESRDKMLASEESVARAIRNDNAWIGRKQPHIAPRSNMSAITGLDNRQALPPYFPIERSEDRLFGIMLGAMFPDVAALDYPWAAPHLTIAHRDTTKGKGVLGQLGKSELLTEWLGSSPSAAGKLLAQSSLWDMVIAITQFASLTEEDLAEMANDLTMTAATRDLVDITDCLALCQHGPESWMSFMIELRQNTELRLGELLSSNPHGQKSTFIEAVQIWKSIAKEFAGAVNHWREFLEI